LKLPNFLRSTTGIVVTIVVAVVLLVSIGLLSWSHSRFTRSNVCLTCHEIFVEPEEYMQSTELSESVEDFRPTKEIDLGHWNMTVGCAECHAYPFEEYRESAHYDNERGIKAGCLGCHNPHSVREFLVWKFFYINKGTIGESPFHTISSGLRDIPEWEDTRPILAHEVRAQMLAEDSAKCKVCHKTESEWFNKIKRHQSTEKTCIQCHYNLVHKEVKWKKPEATAAAKDATTTVEDE
jgi:nitrate/TMAO reductase-like tetraheme cytochrome c subunit